MDEETRNLRRESADRNEDHYKKVISYLIGHPEKLSLFQPDYFMSPTYRLLYLSIKELVEKNAFVAIDEVVTVFKKFQPNSSLTVASLQDLVQSFTDFSNIEYIRRILQDDYMKVVTNQIILEDMLVAVNSAGDLDRGKMSDNLEVLMRNLHSIDATSILYSDEELVERHKASLSEEVLHYSMGFSDLDQNLGKPGAPGQISILFGLSYHGKTSFVLSMINALIKKEERIPTLYLSLEMSEEDVMDRLMSLKGDMPFISLRKGGAEARNSYRDHIKGAYQEISESKNFILADRSAVSVANMENIVMEAKEKFHSNGVLREDGYVMVIIDLLTMLTDFKDFSPNLIQQTMDQLLYVAKRQKVHLLGVVQSNENWLRERPLKSLKDVDNFQLSRSSVKGGAGIFERARVVLSVLRRKQLKKEFLPHLEEDWEDDDDILELHCIKDSHGFPFRLNYLFGQNFRIMPFAGPVPGPKTDEGED